MGRNELKDEGVKMVCDALRDSKVSKLEELDLQRNGITVTGAASVAAYLAVTAELTSLDVGYNQIGKEQALALVSIFKEKDQMKSVGLAGCSLGVDGAKTVADYVSVSGSLTEVR